MGHTSPPPLSWLPSDQGGGVVMQPDRSGVTEGNVQGTTSELHLKDALRLLMATVRWGLFLPFHS